VLPYLPASIRSIAISQRGHGESGKPQTNYAVQAYAADLARFLDVLASPRAVVAGHSSASLVARRVATDHPERVSGLILEGSFIKLGDRATTAGARFATLHDPIAPEVVRDFVAGTLAQHVPKDFVDLMVEESLRVPARVWRETFASLLDFDDSTDLAALRIPTLVVWGDEDAIVDRETTQALVGSIRSASLLTFEAVGHTPHWEVPDQFAQGVVSFVEHCRTRN
jgi:pimeloyl-ACP methyl ester carboxylesterase